jgi:hypothetical protein
VDIFFIFFLPLKIGVDPISDPNARMHVYLRNTCINKGVLRTEKITFRLFCYPPPPSSP